ncbi:MAG: TonB-dependent receptor domain-containing protein [Rhodothermales bacterium]
MNALRLGAYLSTLLLNLSFAFSSYGQPVPFGTVKGQLLDAETKLPLIGATVLLAPTSRGTTTDIDGYFIFTSVPVGSYLLRFSYVGYEPVSKTDVIVRSERITFLQAELYPAVLEAEEVIVRAGYFSDAADQPVSLTGFSAEEIRRAPGAAGDVSRIISGLPGIAKVDDMKNSLVVRGGSPTENSFFVDNIEIPNINHFPTQGSSGGAVGLLNVDLINHVDFFAGGFSAAYGDRLSSVMNVQFREGNRDEFDMQFDLSLAGTGFVSEGGLGASQGSWLVSARRSYVDVLVNTFFEEEAGAAMPTYSDVQAKLVYDLAPRHRVTVLDILGMDRSVIDKDDALNEQETFYGDWGATENTLGVNWRFLWGTHGYSNTALSHSVTRFRSTSSKTQTGDVFFDNRSLEQEFRLRNVNTYRVSPAHRFEFGVEAKLLHTSYDQYYAASTDLLGHATPALRVDDDITAAKLGAFVSYRWHPLSRLSVTSGLRLDHFTFNGHTHISPRMAASYQLTSRTAFNAALGLYAQNLPLVLLAQSETNKALKNPVAFHYIIGMQHLLTDHTRLTIEVYNKAYRHFPLDPTQPSLFIIDQLFYQNGFFLHHEHLVDTGKAYTRGVELMIQKKLARNVYGMISGSYFRSRYRDYDGEWHNRVFDNRYLFNVEGGYKPSHKHEISGRWIYAGGTPYTPFDFAESRRLNQGILDVNQVNAARLPAYHSLNLRYDRRFHFKRSTLIAYLSVWNVYGRRNLSALDWNESDNAPRSLQQWGTLPILGLEFEF